jgi:putative endopeptidase
MKLTKYLLALTPMFLFLTTALYAGDGENGGHGLDLRNLDTSVKPADDFFQYSVGGWVKNNPIPDEFSRWGSFELLRDNNNKTLQKIVEATLTAKNVEKGSAKQKIGDFYATGMDSAKIEADGYAPIVDELKQIDALKNKTDLIKFLAQQHNAGSGALFNFFSSPDSKKSDMVAAHIYQGGVGLPDVEYYTKDDARSKEIRERYVVYVTNMFKLTGVDEKTAAQYAKTIMKVETQLAKESNTRVENRDPVKTYNKFTISELKKKSKGFNWDVYLNALMNKTPEYVIVFQPKFIKEVGVITQKTSLSDLKVYLKWDIIRNAAPSLSSAFVNEGFEFNGKFLSGTKALKPRWKRVLAVINGNLGELVGQLYVAEVFPPQAKERANAIVKNLLISMGERIKGVEWMSDKTKEAALYKLSKFAVKIGYPDKWKDYSDLAIEHDSYYKNIKRASIWASKVDLEKIGKPVDKTEWEMSPQTVNAYYNPNGNEIVFPAAILQPPFFNQEADDAVNYGGMGAVIGHEISHGFDDQGRQFDADGNITDWWTKEDAEKFTARADKLVDEFNNFVIVDTFKVNGSLTLGENIGDLGGVTVALNALKHTEQYKKGEKLDGFTPVQRFFLSWGQIWAEYQRPEALKLQLKTDPHSPGRARVLGPLMNVPEFWDAFGVKPGDKMRNPEDKLVKIW